MSDPISQSGYVVSDLHLFAGWSKASKYLKKMRSAATGADFFVLNGDIFDFRWTTMPSVERTAKAAAEWLGDFAAVNPNCVFHYVLGNHDCCENFVEHLEMAADEISNLNWHPSHLRMGSALFMHGDLPIGGKAPFSREICSAETKKGNMLSRSYGRLIKMGAHKSLCLFFRKKRCAKRILREVRSDADGPADGVTDIYFGHTHVPFSGYTYDGVTFHNTGSTIWDLEFNMLPVRI